MRFTEGQEVGANPTHQSKEGRLGECWVYPGAKREEKVTERIDTTC